MTLGVIEIVPGNNHNSQSNFQNKKVTHVLHVLLKFKFVVFVKFTYQREKNQSHYHNTQNFTNRKNLYICITTYIINFIQPIKSPTCHKNAKNKPKRKGNPLLSYKLTFFRSLTQPKGNLTQIIIFLYNDYKKHSKPLICLSQQINLTKPITSGHEEEFQLELNFSILIVWSTYLNYLKNIITQMENQIDNGNVVDAKGDHAVTLFFQQFYHFGFCEQ